MNCPHCHWRIDDAVVIKAAAQINGKKDRPGAKGLIRNPKGRPKKETK